MSSRHLSIPAAAAVPPTNCQRGWVSTVNVGAREPSEARCGTVALDEERTHL